MGDHKLIDLIEDEGPRLVRAGIKARRAFRAWRDRVRIRKGETPKGSRMELNLGTRTSTNAAVGGGILGSVYVQAVGLLPWPGLVSALTTPEMVVLVGTLCAWAVARISRTPVNPGKI